MRLVRDSIDHFFLHGLHVESRTIYVGDDPGEGINEVVSARLIKAIHLLTLANKDPIKIILNSVGGSFYDGMGIYDMIKSSSCHVTIEVLGCAMSMASIILQAADERVVYPNTTIMLHDPSDSIEASAKTFEAWGDYSKVSRRRMYEIYASRSSNKSVAFWEKRCAKDYILTAEQAKSFGLVDRIVGE